MGAYGNPMFEDRNRMFQGGYPAEMQNQPERLRRMMGGGMDEPTAGWFVGKGPRGYRRPDDRIREEISDALTRHPNIDASNIDVKVDNGDVTLSGTVEGRIQKRWAEAVAEWIEGVKDVHNVIKVLRTNEATNNIPGPTTTTTGRSRSSSSSAT
jgi:hypothetical protein